MLATILNTNYYALHLPFAEAILPFVEKAYLQGTELNLPKTLKSKARQAEISDENGFLVPYVAVSDVQQGQPRTNSSTTKNIAVVPLTGIMQKNGDFCGYGTKDVVAWIAKANADPNISGIVLFVDSPGGSVDGTEELSQAVQSSAKPIVAFVDGLAASAAVWVASQAKSIFINQETTAFFGSIGVFSTLINQAEALKQNGIEVKIIRDSTSPNKARPNAIEIATEEDVIATVSELDKIKSTFVSYVKNGRGNRLKEGNHYDGSVFNGEDAVKRGLVDKVGTLQDAVNEAAKLASKQESNNLNNNKKQMKIKASASPLLAKAMGFSPESDEEIGESHIASAESYISDLAKELEEKEKEVLEAKASLETISAKLKEEEAELATLREWKKSVAGFQIGPDVEASKPKKKLSQINAEGQAFLDAHKTKTI